MAWSAGYRSCCRPARSRSQASRWLPWPGHPARAGRRRAPPAACSLPRPRDPRRRAGLDANQLPRPPSAPGGGGPFRIIPLADVLDGAFGARLGAGQDRPRGVHDAGGRDRPAPRRRAIAGCGGVEILGNAIETILHQRFLVPAPRRSVVVLIVALALIGRAARRRATAAGDGAARSRRARRVSDRGEHACSKPASDPGPGAPAGRASPDLRGGTRGPRRVRTGRAAPAPRSDGSLPFAIRQPVGAWPIPVGCASRRASRADRPLQRSAQLHDARPRACRPKPSWRC